MARLLGPVLSFRGCDNNTWKLTAIAVSKNGQPVLSVNQNPVAAEVIWNHPRGNVYRYTFAFPMSDAASVHTYTLDGDAFDVAVPAKGQSPTMAYMSCSGYSSAALAKNDPDKYRLWRALARKHGLDVPLSQAQPGDKTIQFLEAITPYHLLLLGGDQVYADAMKDSVPSMRNWFAKGWNTGNSANLTATMARQLHDFYFDLYVREWSRPEIQQIMARVPSIAMWDDHELIDGWGSYAPARQNCAVFGGIWKAAAKAFAVFQQHLSPVEFRPGSLHIGGVEPSWWQEDLPSDAGQEKRLGSFSFAYVVGDVAIVVPDLRSQRTMSTQVVNRQAWDTIFDWVAQQRDRFKHLLVMSSIPVLYPNFALIESALGWFPGHQDLEDDLRDQWSSVPHQGERARLVNRLFDFAKTQNGRGTILSGDVHVAALATIHSSKDRSAGMDTELTQLISSGIIHPAPGAIVLFALNTLFDASQVVDDNAIGEMATFPGTRSKFVGTRNYLSLEPDAPDQGIRLWCNWIVENEPSVFTKVIHPIASRHSQ